MSTLERIVPPLELCKQIPAGEFRDPVLVWKERIGNSRDARVKIREPEDISYKVESVEVNYFPAPTLEEILDEMVSFRASFCVHGMAIGNNFYGYPTSAEEALLMWLKLKGFEVK